MCNANSTTQPLSCRDWDLYTVECRALMDELMRDHPGLSARDAHQCAAAYIDSGMLEQFAAEWDEMVAAFAAGETEVIEHQAGAVVNPTGASFVPVDGDDDPNDDPPAAMPDPATERARNKAAYHLAGGLDIRFLNDGSALVPSGTRGGTIHRVSSSGQCSCEAGQAGKVCWHTAAVDLLLETGQAAA